MMDTLRTVERGPAGYDNDTTLWADRQANLLRERRFDEIDLENVIEEIESLGRSDRLALTSHVGTIMEHLLKLELSPATDPKRKWRATVTQARRNAANTIDASPSLKRHVAAIAGRQALTIANDVCRALRDYDELTPDIERRVRERCFTRDEILGDWLP